MGRVQTGVAAACVVLGITVAGCGTSSKKTTTATITKAAFVTKVNALCDVANHRNRAATAKLGNSPTKTQIVGYVTKTFVPDIQAVIDGSRALGFPAGDQATLTSILDTGQSDLNKVKAKPLALSPGLFANFAKPAHAYGLTHCARNA